MKENKQIAEIVIDIAGYALEQTFYYRVPEILKHRIAIGSSVLVPLRNRNEMGYIVGYADAVPVDKIKDIEQPLGEKTWFDENMLDLARWMAQYYMCSLGDAINCILPAGIKNHIKEIVYLNENRKEQENRSPQQQQMIRKLIEQGPLEKKRLLKELGLKASDGSFKQLLQLGDVTIKMEILPPKIQVRYEDWAILSMTPACADEQLIQLRNKAPKQAAVLSLLIEEKEMSVSSLMKAAAATRGTLKALKKKGWITFEKKELYRNPFASLYIKQDRPQIPTMEQQHVLESIEKEWDGEQKRPILLHGVTGSGKTEVYLQAITQVIKKGKEAIVLVPEISLTPQMVKRFKARFGHEVAVLHSALSMGERYDEWRRIKEGHVKVVVGARSAVFAPFSRLGLIIIDEEHENTYKQACNPRYHAREVAIRRSIREGAQVILGTATPSLESYQRALKGEYLLLEMKQRIDGRLLPPVKLVDLREEMKKGNRSILSGALQQAIKQRLENKEQTILFLNRRGFSTFVLCRQCGLVLRCRHCDVSLTYHAAAQKMRCHFCDREEPIPQQCPVCHSPYIKHFGIGTEKVEQVIKNVFPEARILRMDMDTTSRKGDHERLLSAFECYEADILIGTQMIAKGLDFERVTLVGVISADTSLHFPDFRAGERTFQLMTQVGGRAGRGILGGEVIVQTYSPEHYSLQAASQHDYKGFYAEEIKTREELDYPPFTQLIRILISSNEESKTIEGAEILGGYLSACADQMNCQILGPVQAPISKIKNAYRWHIIIKGMQINNLQALVCKALTDYKSQSHPQVDIHIDVDPLSML